MGLSVGRDLQSRHRWVSSAPLSTAQIATAATLGIKPGGRTRFGNRLRQHQHHAACQVHDRAGQDLTAAMSTCNSQTRIIRSCPELHHRRLFARRSQQHQFHHRQGPPGILGRCEICGQAQRRSECRLLPRRAEQLSVGRCGNVGGDCTTSALRMQRTAWTRCPSWRITGLRSVSILMPASCGRRYRTVSPIDSSEIQHRSDRRYAFSSKSSSAARMSEAKRLGKPSLEACPPLQASYSMDGGHGAKCAFAHPRTTTYRSRFR